MIRNLTIVAASSLSIVLMLTNACAQNSTPGAKANTRGPGTTSVQPRDIPTENHPLQGQGENLIRDGADIRQDRQAISKDKVGPKGAGVTTTQSKFLPTEKRDLQTHGERLRQDNASKREDRGALGVTEAKNRQDLRQLRAERERR